MNLLNVEERNAAFPTFEIPDRDEREGLKPGDTVKLVWEEAGRGGERMWVRVEGGADGRFIGTLDNKPTVFTNELRLGDTVGFGPEHVAAVQVNTEPFVNLGLLDLAKQHKIGNLRRLAETLIETAERGGNDAEHQLGIELVDLARREGLSEEQIIEALTHGKMYVRIESAMARARNEALRGHAQDNPGHADFALGAETWEGYVPEMENMEEIFRFFNRVEFGDGERLEAIGYDLPSLSVGDVVEWNGVRRRAEPVGWVEIKDEPLCRRCGTPLGSDGRCGDETCPYSDRSQDETWTEG